MKSSLHRDLARAGWLHDSDVPIDVSKVDWVNVLRFMSGKHVDSHDIAARKIAADVLTARGWSAASIASATGMTERNVVRLRARPICGRPDPLLPRVLGWTAIRADRNVTAVRGVAA